MHGGVLDPKKLAAIGVDPVADFGVPMYEKRRLTASEAALLKTTGEKDFIFLCQRCDAKYAEWVVDDRDWLKVPKRWRKRRLCRNCYRTVVGLPPLPSPFK